MKIKKYIRRRIRHLRQRVLAYTKKIFPPFAQQDKVLKRFRNIVIAIVSALIAFNVYMCWGYRPINIINETKKTLEVIITCSGYKGYDREFKMQINTGESKTVSVPGGYPTLRHIYWSFCDDAYIKTWSVSLHANLFPWKKSITITLQPEGKFIDHQNRHRIADFRMTKHHKS